MHSLRYSTRKRNWLKHKIERKLKCASFILFYAIFYTLAKEQEDIRLQADFHTRFFSHAFIRTYK